MGKAGILIPAYNEEKTIGKVVEECKANLPNALILVVDDGSTDKTGEIAGKHGAKVLRHEVNKGKGEALKTGLEYFRRRGFDFVGVIDADLQYSARDLKKIFSALKYSDVVMGCRYFSHIPFRHRLGNFVWRTAFNFLFGTGFRDTNCGLLGFSQRALREIKNIHGGYIVENSILAEAVEKNMKVTQVPVRVRYHATSSLARGTRIVLGVLLFILKEGLKYRFRKLFSKISG